MDFLKWPASVSDICKHQGQRRVCETLSSALLKLEGILHFLRVSYDSHRSTFCVCRYFALKRMTKIAIGRYLGAVAGVSAVDEDHPKVKENEVDFDLYKRMSSKQVKDDTKSLKKETSKLRSQFHQKCSVFDRLSADYLLIKQDSPWNTYGRLDSILDAICQSDRGERARLLQDEDV